MRIEFKVEGMSCQHCVVAVTNAIRAQLPSAQVQVDRVSGRVTVESAQQVDVNLLKTVVDEVGYTVTGVPSGAPH